MIKVIVITKNKHRIITKFGSKIKKAKRFRKLVKTCGESHIAKVCLVDMSTVEAPPKGLVRERGMMWCSYCKKQRHFRSNYRGDDYSYCEVCGISDADFWIKSHNQLWSNKNPPEVYNVTTQEDRAEVRQEKMDKKRERREARKAKAEAEAAKAAKKKRRA